MLGISPLTVLWILWGCTTAALIAVWIYRSVIGAKEDDQLFLDANEAKQETEQHEIVARVEKLSYYIKVFGAVSITLLVVIGGIFLYHGIDGLLHPTIEH